MMLDKRLRAVADAVRPGSVAADVGTDHGYLVCALVEEGRCPRGFASDIRPMPLAAATGHIRERGLADRIASLLSDGLRALPGGEIDDIILAGMGGELIAELLTAVPWTRDPAKRFVLQPMTRADHLRRRLYREGFALTEETAVSSGRFVYTVMSAVYSGERREIDERFAQTGLLWDKRDEDSRAYLSRVARRLRKRAAGLSRAEADNAEASALFQLISQIEERVATHAYSR